MIRRTWLLIVTLLQLAATPSNAADWSLAPGECVYHPGDTMASLVFDGVRSAQGNLVVTLYGDRPEDFLAKGKKLSKLNLPAHTGEARACLTLPAPGTYAIAAFHDEDHNGRLNRSFLNMPTEGYGFPNSPGHLLAPPSFEKVAIDLAAGVTVVRIVMHYP